MNISPLKLKIYGVDEFIFKTDNSFDGKFDIQESIVKVDKKHFIDPNNELMHCISLKIDIKPKLKGSFPYRLSLTIMGFFDTDAEFYKNDEGQLADINGSSILFGAAREYIYLATSHGKFGSVMLPVTSFAPAKKASKKKS